MTTIIDTVPPATHLRMLAGYMTTFEFQTGLPSTQIAQIRLAIKPRTCHQAHGMCVHEYASPDASRHQHPIGTRFRVWGVQGAVNIAPGDTERWKPGKYDYVIDMLPNVSSGAQWTPLQRGILTLVDNPALCC